MSDPYSDLAIQDGKTETGILQKETADALKQEVRSRLSESGLSPLIEPYAPRELLVFPNQVLLDEASGEVLFEPFLLYVNRCL